MDDKMAKIVALVGSECPYISPMQVAEYIEADWPEGQEHLDWLETASPTEIACWVIEALRNWDFEEGPA